MIGQLIQLANELEGNLRETLSSQPLWGSVIGAGIDVDSYWEVCELADQFGYYDPYIIDQLLYQGRWQNDAIFEERLRYLMRVWRGRRSAKADFDFRPENWESHCKFMGYRVGSSPVIFKVYLDRAYDKGEFAEFPNQLAQQYPIIYEKRKRPMSKSSPLVGLFSQIRALFNRRLDRGVSLINEHLGTSGTLGGLLRDQPTGQIYMVTCAHVAGRVKDNIFARRRGSTQRIGTVSISELPPVIDGTMSCSHTGMPGGRCVDISMVRLDQPITFLGECGSIPQVRSIAEEGDLRKNDVVRFVGKESGAVTARIGKWEIWMEMEVWGERRCYRGLVELRPEDENWYVRKELAKPGDSGAWVIDEISGAPRWVGMVVAADAPFAYMCLAGTILSHCNEVAGPFVWVQPDL